MVQRLRGFTIVEIVVVVTVIGILTAIITLGFLQQQANSRDSRRTTSAQLITEALEKYYDKNGEYPPCTAITDSAANVSTNTLIGIDQNSLLAPQDTTGGTNSIKCSDLTSLSQPDFFAYVGDGSTECQTGAACLSFTIKYKLESKGQIGTITSRRNTNIATSGKPVLSTPSVTGFDSINLSWTSVPNSTGYTVQRATDSGFTLNLTSTDYVGVNASVTGLAYNTTYYYRVRAISGTNSFTDWSNIGNGTTWSMAQPTCSVTANSLSQLTVSWNAISHAASYTVDYDDNAAFSSPTSSAGNIGTSKAITAFTPGTTVYLRVKPVSGTYAGNWCSTVSYAAMPATAPTVSYGSVTTTTMQYSWTTVYGAARYESQYRVNSGAWSATINEGTNTSRGHGPTTVGTRIEIQVRAVDASGNAGNWSAPSGGLLAMPTPAWNAWGRSEAFPSWGTWVYNTGGASLCSGTSIYTQFRDGIQNSFWNGWGAFGSNGASSETLHYGSTVGDYSSVLQTEIQGYCRNDASGAQSGVISTGVSTAVHTAPNVVLSGPVECAGTYSGRSAFQLRLQLQETSYNLGANQSNVHWTLYRVAVASGWQSYDQTKTWPWSVSINGSGWSGASNSSRWRPAASNVGETEIIASSDLTVGHDGNGNATIGFAGADGPGSSIFGSASCSGAYGLSDLR